MKKTIVLFLFISTLFILVTSHSEARNTAQRDHLEKYFTEYTNRYLFTTNTEVDNHIRIISGKEIAKSILKDIGLL